MISGVSAVAGGTSGATVRAPATAGGSFVATAFLATALRFFFAAFLSADFNFRVRIAFFFAALRFVGMGSFLSTSNMWHRPYNRYLRGVQVVRLTAGKESITVDPNAVIVPQSRGDLHYCELNSWHSKMNYGIDGHAHMSITFAKAPLIEIIAELRWIPQGSKPITGALTDESGSPTVFLGGPKQEEFYERLSAEFHRSDFSRSERVMPLGSPFILHQPVYRFRSEAKDKTSIIYQVGYGLFSVHGIPPYRSWNTFLPFVTTGIGALLKSRPEDDVKQTFSQLSLRYIDFFDESLMQGLDIPTFLSKVFGITITLPAALTRVATSNQIKTLLNKVTVPTELGELTVSVGDGTFNNRPGILLDSIASSTKGDPASLDEIMRMFDSAYGVIHRMFFELTKSLHELMLPGEAE